MNIAQIGPIWYRIPPIKYGGTELIVHHLTEELVRRGHQVTLFATGDSVTKARLQSFFHHGLFEQGYSFEDFSDPLYHTISVLDNASAFDILHFHFTSKMDYVNMALVRNMPNVLFTLHVPLPEKKELLNRKRLLEERLHMIPLVSISNNQRAGFQMHFINTVYNAIDITQFPYTEAVIDGQILWLSRISYQKGTVETIQTAKRLNLPLILVGKVDTNAPHEVDYFDHRVKPLLNGLRGTLYGEINPQEKILHYRQAKLFLFPIQWEEPFGLVMIEAMACGTPIVAFARGSVPEVVVDGVTGFIVNSSDQDVRGNWVVRKTGIDGLCEAVERIYKMPEDQYRVMRAACRKHVETHFTVEKMVDGYEQAYRKILNS